LDLARYKALKLQLPYVVAARFNPAYRNKTNFAATDYFILDIDHVANAQIDMNTLKEKLSTDDRVELLFASPGGDGLKLFFRLNERCFDGTKYAVFYKHFAEQFGLLHNIQGLIDTRTCDVSRACFLSADTEAYFNPNAEAVQMENFVNFENSDEFQQVFELDFRPKKDIVPIEKPALSVDIFAEIKAQFTERKRIDPPKKTFAAPKEVDVLLELIRERLMTYGIELRDTRAIQFGSQLTFGYQNKWAEMNVFYGKKGYSLVKSTKNGSHAELCDLVYLMVRELLADL
ncbi:MAG: hypothetical protein RIS47_1584, partial [Bacteroidota bacterium]